MHFKTYIKTIMVSHLRPLALDDGSHTLDPLDECKDQRNRNGDSFAVRITDQHHLKHTAQTLAWFVFTVAVSAAGVQR